MNHPDPVSKTVFRLYPPPYAEVPLRGLYLAQRLHARGARDKPFVYANFLASLDGRIALEDSVTGLPYLPRTLTTPDDFRLFLELEAQADCLITHGGYLRALAEGKLGNILQIGLRPDSHDLAEWRRVEGLPPQPAIVIASANLNFPLPDSIRQHGQRCYIATGKAADPERVAHWRERGIEVLFCGEGNLAEGGPLVRQLGDLGYRCIYLIAGPHVLDTMVRDGQLKRLYQTITHQLMGGKAFRTLVPGPELGPTGHLILRGLYYDPAAPHGAGQWFAQFENAPA
jgi:riboflavin biosynthesis pyrimidine reductase